MTLHCWVKSCTRWPWSPLPAKDILWFFLLNTWRTTGVLKFTFHNQKLGVSSSAGNRIINSTEVSHNYIRNLGKSIFQTVQVFKYKNQVKSQSFKARLFHSHLLSILPLKLRWCTLPQRFDEITARSWAVTVNADRYSRTTDCTQNTRFHHLIKLFS